MVDIKLEIGKVYRTGAGHLVAVRREISKGKFICVRKAGDYSELQIFREDGYPDQSGPVSKRFRVQEEVVPTPEISDPQPWSRPSFNSKEHLDHNARLKEYISHEIRLAMQQQMTDSLSGVARGAVADIRATMIMNAIEFDIRQGHVTEISHDHIDQKSKELVG
jgi:hypothetical protein